MGCAKHVQLLTALGTSGNAVCMRAVQQMRVNSIAEGGWLAGCWLALAARTLLCGLKARSLCQLSRDNDDHF